MISIDKLAYNNELINVHPFEKIIFSVGSLISISIFNNYIISLLILVLMVFLILYKVGITISVLLKLFILPSFFILTAIIPIVLQISFHTQNGFIVIMTEESSIKGILIVTNCLSSISCFYFLILTTPIEQIDYFLKKLKVPVLFCELFMLIYRYIFLFWQIMLEIFYSQKMRYGYRSFFKSVNSLAMLSSSLLIKTIHYSDQSFMAMQIRGGNNRFQFAMLEKQIDKRNWYFISFYFLLIILVELGISI